MAEAPRLLPELTLAKGKYCGELQAVKTLVQQHATLTGTAVKVARIQKKRSVSTARKRRAKVTSNDRVRMRARPVSSPGPTPSTPAVERSCRSGSPTTC